jgi:hypothetical protein
MKNFLAIYTGTSAALAQWQSLPEADRQKREAATFEGPSPFHALPGRLR